MKKLIQLLLLLFTFIGVAQTNVINYTASNQNFANPERGSYHYTEAQSGSYSLINQNQLESWRVNDNITMIIRIFYLKDFISSPISQTYLNNIQTDFDRIRAAGLKCVIKFAYSENTNGAYDASKTQILAHLQQLKPYIQNNADVIAIMQAGFIGVWGEWYYTDHFGMPPTATDYQNRKDIVEAILDILPSNRMIQIRTPKLKTSIYSTNPISENESFDGTYASRIGHHNDCFLASNDDYGTYVDISNEYPYLLQETKYTPMGGETCNDNQPRSGCTTAVEEMELFHWSYLNADYHATVLNGFENNGCYDDIKKRLGYRFELISGTFPYTATGTLPIDLTLNNKGFASLYNPRNAFLVLRNTITNDEYKIVLTSDPRTWASGTNQINISEILNLPPDIIDGDYNLYLHLPDSGTSLNTNPAYAIRLANENMWESNTGYNNLNATVTINDQALAINDNAINDFKIYPVPANNEIVVELENSKDYEYALYNLVGQKVTSKTQSISNNRISMNTQNLENGIYILKIENGTIHTSKKIIIQH